MKKDIKKKGIMLVVGIMTLIDIFAHEINISERGAVGDGFTDNTTIIQNAIDECSQNAGTVVIPSGKFLTRTLFLKSNVQLYLEFGAELLGSTDLQSYHDVTPYTEGKGGPALIYAIGQENIAITGMGTINGQGQHKNFQHGNDAEGGPKRPKIIYFIECKNVKIKDINLINSAYWVQDYENCDGILIKGIKVYSHANWNNDGLDIDSRNVIVSDCHIDCDDDALCFKSDTERTCENITVTNCVLKSNCNAIKFGTGSSTGFKDITISNCVISKASEDNRRQWYNTLPWLGTKDKTVIAGVALESVDGGSMEQIIVSNIVMSDVQTPIFIRLGDRKRTKNNKISSIKNILINNIIAESASKVACSVTGISDGFVENITIKDIRMTLPGGGTKENITATVPEQREGYPENRMFGVVLPASGFYVRHVKNIRFENIEMESITPDVRPMFYLDTVEDVEIINCKMNGNKPIIKRKEKANI